MVRITALSWRRLAITLALAALAVVLLPIGVGAAHADPTSTPAPSTTTAAPTPGNGTGNDQGGQGNSLYGYAQQCNSLGQSTGGQILGSLIPGGALLNLLPGGHGAGDAVTQACQLTNALTHPGEAATALWNSGVGKFAQAAMSSWSDGITLMMTWWMHIPISDDFVSTAPNKLRDATAYVQVALLAFSICVSGLRLAWARRHAQMEAAEETGRMLVRSAFASWSFAPVLLAGQALGHAVAQYLLAKAAGDGSVEGAIKNLLYVGIIPGLGPVLILVMSLLGIIGALVMAVFVVMQLVMLMPIIGFAPIVGAASGTKAGAQAWEKIKGWGIAFVLFQPVAASMIALALWASNGATPMGRVLGMIMLCMSSFALPALMRLVVPAVGAVGSGGGAAAMVGGAMATGATVGSMMSGMGGSAASTAGEVGGVGGQSNEPTGNSGGGGEAAMLAATAMTGGAAGAAGAAGGAEGAGAGAFMGGQSGGGGGQSGGDGMGQMAEFMGGVSSTMQAMGTAVDDTNASSGGGYSGPEGSSGHGGRSE